MKSDNNIYEQWHDAIYSGKYVHPVTKENMPTTPPIEKEPIEQEIDKKIEDIPVVCVPPNKQRLPVRSRQGLIVTLTLACLLFIGYFIHLFTSNDPGKEISTHKELFVGNHVHQIIDGVVEGITLRLKSLMPERVIEERVKIVRIKDNGQKAALEQIKAWKYIHEKLIDNFFNTKALSGKRSLCIKYGKNTECTVIDTIDIRPDLPGRLRRNTNADIDLSPM